MFHWVYAHAPIRRKFDVIIAAHVAIVAIVAATIVLVADPIVHSAIAVTGLLATVLVGLVSKWIVCTPYTETVRRMETLAAGDFDSPVRHTDHQDCVGRMTRAMAVFADNMRKVQSSGREMNLVVEELSAALNQIQQGNLGYRIEQHFGGGYDGLREAFNHTLTELASTLNGVSSSATHVHTGSAEIRAASDDLSQRTEQQAASLQETTAAMKQVTATVQDTARNATAVNVLVTDAHREAIEGGEVVSRAVEAMSQIEKSASEISQIINVIDGIAFQTNLLALNAGVEAARAGDAGKGFAVVANEVRALAQRSAEAAKDIKGLIGTSSEQVDGGVALVRETGVRLEQIVGRVAEINTAIQSIAQSAETQAANLQQVSSAVVDMDKVTQQNAAMVEQSTAAARSLAGEADALTALVARFRTAEEQVRAPARPDVRAARKAPRPAPIMRGNLALKVTTDEQDWTEF